MTSNVLVDPIEQIDDLLEATDEPISQASSIAFCGACFSDRVSELIQSSKLLKGGFSAPVVRTEPENGKLIVKVDVCSTKLPKAADDKQRTFLEAVNVTTDAFRCAFELPARLSWPDLEKWIRIEFSDVDAAMKSTTAKRVIAIYDNRQLVLV
jgi:hypothetical protein